VDSSGRTIFVADVHHGDGDRFIIRADKELTEFLTRKAGASKDCYMRGTPI
jgi:hypothetical protein